jgi:hypothetical protein
VGVERKNGSRDVSTNYGSDATSKLTPDELIRLELRGKFLAIERYDSMLWKIRSGYVVVLYGALTIIGGTSGLTATSSLGSNRVLGAAILLIWGFSLSGLAVDYFFLRAKFRVVNDVNALKDLALSIATGKTIPEAEYDALRDLLHISGEKVKTVRGPQFLNAFVSVIWVYLSTPLLAVVVLYLLWSR